MIFAVKINKVKQITNNASNYTRQEYYFAKGTLLEFSTEISLMIEEEFSPEENRDLDTRLVLNSFNDQLQILKGIF